MKPTTPGLRSAQGAAPFLSANGAASYQPRATPWEGHAPRYRGLKARSIGASVGPGFQPSVCFVTATTQGVALGWYGAGALPLRMAARRARDAGSDALSLPKGAVVLENIKRSLSSSNGGLLK